MPQYDSDSYGTDSDADDINFGLNMPRLTELYTNLCKDLAELDPEYGDLMRFDDFVQFVKSTTTCFKYLVEQ